MARQVENMHGLSRGRRGIRLLLMMGMLIAGAGLIRVAGGFPPQVWIFLVQILPRVPQLWRARGMAIVPALGALLVVAFSLLLAWLLLLYFCVKVGKSLLVPGRAKQRFAAREEWNGGDWHYKDHDEETYPIVWSLDDKGDAGVSSNGLMMRMQEQRDGFQGKRMTEPLMPTRRNEVPILGARERYYARFSEPETQPLDVLAMTCERAAGLSERRQRVQGVRQEMVSALMPGGGQQWWVQEEGRTHEDGKERDEQWWMQVAQTDQDDLPTSEPGQDEESERAFIVEAREDEAIEDHDVRSSLKREDDDGAGSTRKNVESEGDVRPVTFVFSIGLDVGIAHKGSPNEDCVFATTGVRVTKSDPEPTGLFMVADGLGGHEQGREASQLAVSTVSESMMPVVLHGTAGRQDEAEAIREGARRANAALYRRNCEQMTSMGTTLTAAFLVGRKASIVNVGDSRTYLFRPGEGLRQVTRDHSLVMRMVEVGAIAREDVYVHPLRNQVYRSLGNAAEVEVETTVIDVREGDVLLLCSDGLWEMVRDDEIEAIIGRGNGPTVVSGRLVQAALRNGGADNIGVVVVSIVAADI